jgi:hypothetical protein
MRRSRSMNRVLPAILAGLLLACGGEAAKEEADADPAAEAVQADSAPSQAPTPAASPTDAPVTVADIDGWAKGMAGELEAVQAAGAKLKEAKTGDDTVSAMMGVQEMNTLEAGAGAAGMDAERYRFVKSNLSAAASYLAPELGGVDPATLSPAQREEMKKNDEAQLAQLESAVPADVVTALRPRAADLRRKDLELVAARLKGAGMGR